MASFRRAIVSLLLVVMPVQGYTMARMQACEPAAAMQTQAVQTADDGAETGCHQPSSSAAGDHQCFKCPLCAMCAAAIAPASVAVAALRVSVQKPRGLFFRSPQYFPDGPSKVPRNIVA